ncbi:MAG: DUF86 domain-containing protein [Ignavibacteriales bacterium]
MSKRDWKILFEDILDSIDKIFAYTKDFEFEDFISSSLVVDAVVRNIEIIGEASKNVPEEVKLAASEIPWNKMAGIRNRIVHEYFGVDKSIIWFIVRNELPSLKLQIQNYLSDNSLTD